MNYFIFRYIHSTKSLIRDDKSSYVFLRATNETLYDYTKISVISDHSTPNENINSVKFLHQDKTNNIA